MDITRSDSAPLEAGVTKLEVSKGRLSGAGAKGGAGTKIAPAVEACAGKGKRTGKKKRKNVARREAWVFICRLVMPALEGGHAFDGGAIEAEARKAGVEP